MTTIKKKWIDTTDVALFIGVIALATIGTHYDSFLMKSGAMIVGLWLLMIFFGELPTSKKKSKTTKR